MDKTLRNKLSFGTVIFGGAVGLASLIVLVGSTILDYQTKKDLKLIQNIQSNDPNVVIDTETYREGIKTFDKVSKYSISGLILGGTMAAVVRSIYERK